jgi:hypothetical protein
MSNVSSTTATNDWEPGPAMAAGVTMATINLVALLYSLLVGANRCDESCNDNLVAEAHTSGWQDWLHSWQWNALWIVSAVALLLAIVGAAHAAQRNIYATYILYGLSASAFVAWGMILLS